jgi:hypothetical protein
MSDRASKLLQRAFCQGSLEHTMPYQNVVKYLSLPFIIVHIGGIIDLCIL